MHKKTRDTDMSDRNIYQRINAVMKAVEYVQKDSVIDNKYAAVSHDMVVAVLRKAMVENGLVVRPVQLKGKYVQMRDLEKEIKMHLYVGRYQVDFVNVDHPEDYCRTVVEGHANDNGDKAPGKAMSYAVKYAMLKTFSLETGESDESRVAEEDITDISQQITAAETMDDLQATFKLAWHHYPKSRQELTKIKDARKKELSND